MGRGFPTRTSRRNLAGILNAALRAVQPDEDLGGDDLNAILWCLAGHNQAGALCWAHVADDGTLERHGEAWNPEADPALAPTTATTGTGVYTITYPDTALDEDSLPSAENASAAPLDLGTIWVTPQGATPLLCAAEIAHTGDEWVITVRFLTHAGAAADTAFGIEVR
jgi:hypothetical protein